MMSLPSIIAGEIRDVKLSDVKVNPQTRIRQHSTDFKNNTHYKALKKSMFKYGMLHPLTLDINLELIGGFYRFCVATELGWNKIKARIVDVSNFDKIFIEIIENYHRKDFSSYEFYIGLGRLKKEHEINHPETKHGFGRWQKPDPRRDCGMYQVNKEEIGSFLKTKIQPAPSFVKLHYETLGLTERGLRNKTRIGEAILDNKFSDKIMRKLRKGEINQKQLLSLLKKTKIQKKPNNAINETVIPPIQTPRTKKRTTNKPKNIEVSIRKNIVDNFAKTVKEQSQVCGEVRSIVMEVLPPETHETDHKINIRGVGKTKEKKELNEDKCRFCEKATVIAIRCEECGHPTPKVICDDDISKGISRLRKPYLKKCESSLDQASNDFS